MSPVGEEGDLVNEAVVGRLSVDHLDLLEAEAVEEEAILAGLVGCAHRMNSGPSSSPA
jgi:hypothetical protein